MNTAKLLNELNQGGNDSVCTQSHLPATILITLPLKIIRMASSFCTFNCSPVGLVVSDSTSGP